MRYRLFYPLLCVIAALVVPCAHADDVLLKLRQTARQTRLAADSVTKTAGAVKETASSSSVSSVPSNGAGYPVDPDMKRQEEQIATETKDCNKLKNIVAKMDCISAARTRATADRPLRGTAYAIRFYAPLPNSEAVAKWKELRSLRDRSRSKDSFSTTRPKPYGEVTQEMMVDEMRYIADTLRQRGYYLVDEAENPNKPELTTK